MATKRSVRKGRIIVDTGQAGVNAYADVDLAGFEGLAKEFTEWKSAAEGSTDLGTVGGSNLLDAVEKHGVAQRERASSPIGLQYSGNKILDELSKFARYDNGSKVRLPELKDFSVLKLWMEQVDSGSSSTYSKFNPRNIPFQGIRAVDDFGKGIDPYDMFGHYRTPKFEDKMAIVNPEGDYSPVNPAWYAEARNEAKPPLWQAMYGDGTIKDSFQGSESLLQLVQKADKVYDLIRKNLKIGSGSKPVVLDGAGTGVTAYEVDEFKQYADRVATNMDRQGKNSKYVTPAGNLRWRLVQREIASMMVKFDTQKDKSFIKRALAKQISLPDDMEVTEGYVTFGQKQVNQLIYKAGDQRGSYVQLKNANKLLLVIQPERKEQGQEQKSSGYLERSWMDVLKR